MSMASGVELTDLLHRFRAGDLDAEAQFIASLYQDLHAIAARRMRREPSDHTWQPTAPVNEVFLRLRADGTLATASDRTFLLRAACKAMRQLLIDHHRRRSAEKRGGRRQKLSLDIVLDHLARVDEVSFLELRDELDQLGRVDERASIGVDFRFFLGMSRVDVASSLGVSQKTVERDWTFARAWLQDRLKPSERP
jgi:RNA polymerase sigma factor (TIGR02999 family)